MIDLGSARRVHLVGAGGAGMSAIATVLAGMGHEVTGSDLKSSPMLERLASKGLPMAVGHDARNVAGASLVAASTAVPEANPELQAAREAGIPVCSRADILAAIASTKRVIAVAGTHGKTTTSSMLSLILAGAGLRPSFVIGGDANDLETNGVWDEGDWLVIEADESDGTASRLRPELAVVTSVEPDHLEHYGSYEALRESFRTFMSKAGSCVASADESTASLTPPGAFTFGFSGDARFRLFDLSCGRSSCRFDLCEGEVDLGRFELAVPGEHNARNAAAAIAASRLVGVEPELARQALARYAGVARRFEFRGERGGVTFVDDYAHLPSEVRAAIAAARDGGFGRVLAIFQPHRYSRVAALAGDFAGAFAGADAVYVTDIYPAGEAPRPGITGELVADAVRQADPRAEVSYIASRDDLVTALRAELRAGDCCLTLNAGDLTSLPDALLSGNPWHGAGS